VTSSCMPKKFFRTITMTCTTFEWHTTETSRYQIGYKQITSFYAVMPPAVVGALRNVAIHFSVQCS